MATLKDAAADWLSAAPLDLVLVGIGGSILSPSLFIPFAKSAIRIHRLTTPDPQLLQQLFNRLDPTRTRFVILSKSGTTTETIALFLKILSWLEAAKISPQSAVIAICEDNDNSLNHLAKAHAIRRLPAEASINSRFSLFTPIGMFPACLFGLDSNAIRRGALRFLTQFFAAPADHTLIQSAAFSAWGQAHGRNIHAMLFTNPQLIPVSTWWHQIFSESLGKNEHAVTPLWAQLPDDLHIRFQLYLDGPDDKIFTYLAGMPQLSEETIDARGQHWLEGHSLTALMAAQEKVGIQSLLRKDRPLRIIEVGALDEENYGALLMQFILEILLIAKLSGFEAFGQPAIEQGKIDLVKLMTGKE